MEINYEMPLELRCVMAATVAPQGVPMHVLKPYRATILWKDILSVEEAIFNLPFQGVEEPHCHVITARCVYIVKGDFETIAGNWIAYREWLRTRLPNFNLNAN